MNYKTIDLVVPCYNEEAVLETFYIETAKVIASITSPYQFRFIFVNDGSKDSTLSIMRSLAKEHSEVGYISFSRNFGKESAMYAGLQYSTADYVVVMDADLQHPPSMFPDFIKGIEEGYDCVAAQRADRTGEKALRNLLSIQFYKMSNSMTDVQLVHGAVDYRIMSRQMVNSILQLSETQRFSKGLFAWVGYDTKWIPYHNVERTLGETKWNIKSLFRYAIDGITSFSVKPLKWIFSLGLGICILTVLYVIVQMILYFACQIAIPAFFPSLVAILVMGGILECSLGIIGEYLSRIYMSSKNRPIYIAKESNLDAPNQK